MFDRDRLSALMGRILMQFGETSPDLLMLQPPVATTGTITARIVISHRGTNVDSWDMPKHPNHNSLFAPIRASSQCTLLKQAPFGYDVPDSSTEQRRAGSAGSPAR
jgi:hypothetical protein